ncbi:MAG TPA: branched-chain amino acid ABC transporter substrate-binding protein [Candidatus Eremiobacteraceae bacterium]|nr:branched-chain amino acid ABC transporter substrate-binding protein [Candidatus Eremiobacteraceae bacterium]
MQRPIWARLASSIAVASTFSILLSGCTGSGGGGTGPASGNVIKIGSDLPVSGADASDGIPTQNGVQLAVKVANEQKMIPGFTLQADSLDDAVSGVHNPPQGQKNVQALASDPAVVGIVGPFNSNVAQAEIPTSNALGIALVAPSTTNPTLTKGPQAVELRRQNPDQITFFRVCATDDVQGPVGADYAAKTLHLKRAYVVDDNETYGKGIADQWAARFTADGGTVVSHQHLTPGQTDFHALLTDAAAANPDVVFYGGTSATGGDQLRKQMNGSPLANVTMFGGDGIRNDEFLKIAGSMANDVYATVASVNAAKLPAAQSFLKEYQDTYHVPVGSYSASGYVAAMVIIKAAAAAVKANGGKMPSRADVLDQIRKAPKFDTIIGSFNFDQYGDPTTKIISVYEAKADVWNFLTQVKFGT